MKRYKNNLFPLVYKNSSSKTISTGINSKNSNVSSFSKNENNNNANMSNNNKLIKKQHILENSILRKYEFNLEPVIKIEEKHKKKNRRNSIKKEILKCNSSTYINPKHNNLNKDKKNMFAENKKHFLNKSNQQNKNINKHNNKTTNKRNNNTKLKKNNSCINFTNNIKQNKYYQKENIKTEKKTKNKNQMETKLKVNTTINNRTNTISPIRDVKILLFDDTKINLSKLQFSKKINSNIKQINFPYELNEENSSFSQSLPIISTERPIQSIHNLMPKINNKYINNEKKKGEKISEREFDLNKLNVLLTGNTNDDAEFFNNNFCKIPNQDSDDDIMPNNLSSSNSSTKKESYLKDFIQNINVQIKFSEKYELPSNSVIRLLSHLNEQNYLCIQNCFKDYDKKNNDIEKCKFKLIIKNISLCELILKELLDKYKNENELKQTLKFLASLFYESLNLASDINNINCNYHG